MTWLNAKNDRKLKHKPFKQISIAIYAWKIQLSQSWLIVGTCFVGSASTINH